MGENIASGIGICNLAHAIRTDKQLQKNRQKVKAINPNDLVTWDDLERWGAATDKLCGAYRKGMEEKIEGIKKAIYISSGAVGFIIVVFQLILRFI